MFEMERQETTEFYHRRFGNFATIIIIPCGLLLLGIILFLCVAQHETTVVGNAEIIPEGHVQSVQSISNSRMTSNALAEGKHVKTGQLLVAYDDARAQSASRVRATTTGIVHVNRDYQNMSYVPAGSELATITPDIRKQEEIRMLMMVPVTDIGTLAQGQRVHMRMSQHLPTPLMLVGTVKTIDAESTLTKRESVFGVVVVFHLTKKNERVLRYGMNGQGAIVTGRQTYWQYLWTQMRAR